MIYATRNSTNSVPVNASPAEQPSLAPFDENEVSVAGPDDHGLALYRYTPEVLVVV